MEDSYSVVFDCGFAVPITKVTMKDIPLITKAVCLHSTLAEVKAELDQLATGLELFGILSLIRLHSLKMKSLFVYDENDEPSVELMIALFDIQFSPSGSSKRITEEDTVQNWNEFLQDLGNNIISECIDLYTQIYIFILSLCNYSECVTLRDYGINCFPYLETTVHSFDGEKREVTLNLGGLLAFITGADRLPPMGFSDVPLLQFNHDLTFRLPVASTCTPSLTLPTTHNAYEDFKSAMVQGLIEGFGFGTI